MGPIPDRISSLRLCAVSGFAALGALLGGFGMAADTATGPETSTQLSEIVVTAQFREEKLQDTPIAITAITSQMIEQQGATKLSDILNSAPSVVFRQQSAAFGESVTAFIRGFGQADFDPAFEPGVGLYIDDVYYPRLTGANFDLMDVERVEVLRGPQGTLEGRNSEGGAIRFVTKKPTGDEDGYAGITYGTRNRLEMRAGGGLQAHRSLVRENRRRVRRSGRLRQRVQLRLRISGQRRAVGSGGTKCKQYALGDVGYRALRASLRFNPSDQLDVNLQRRLHSRRAQQRCGSPGVRQQSQSQRRDAEWDPAGVPLDSRFQCGKWCNYTTLGNAAGSFVAGLIPPLNGLPMPATSGQQLNTFDAYDFSLNSTSASRMR